MALFPSLRMEAKRHPEGILRLTIESFILFYCYKGDLYETGADIYFFVFGWILGRRP